MSDFDASADAGASDAAVDAPVDEAPVTEAPAAPAEPANPEHVPWKDHVKLRNENATYRQKWSPIEKAFEPYSEDDRTWLLNDFLPLFHQDPRQFSALAREMADRLDESLTPAQAQEMADAGAAAGLTPEQIAQAVAAEMDRREASKAETQRQAAYEAEVQGHVEAIYKQLDEAGIAQDSPWATAVLDMANKQFAGEADAVAKAIDAFRSYEQKRIDDYIAGKGGRPMPTPGSSTAPAPGAPDYGSMSDSEFRASVKAGIGAAFAAPS